MALNINRTKVSKNAPAGTIVGALVATQGNIPIPCVFAVDYDPTNYFKISGSNLVTSRNGPLAPGIYSVKVSATPIVLSAYNNFTITVTVPSVQISELGDASLESEDPVSADQQSAMSPLVSSKE